MIILTLLKVSFYLFLVIAIWVSFALFGGNLRALLKKWKQADLDIKIVSFFPPILLITLLIAFDLYVPEERGYVPLIALMIQLSGITLASVAAIIAFRNYRRKSGDQISYVKEEYKGGIDLLILRNEKDKATVILAIDVVLKSGKRIRLVNFFWPITSPLSLSAFETKKIELGKVHLYGDLPSSSLRNKGISKLICITPSGEVVARGFTISALKDDFIAENEILIARRIRNIAPGYENKDIDSRAEYWVYFDEVRYRNGGDDSLIHILTGFVEDKIFYLTNDSLEYLKDPLHKTLNIYCLRYIHKKEVHGEYKTIIKERDHPYSNEYLVNGFFWGDDLDMIDVEFDRIDYALLQKIEKIEITNCYY